MMNSLQKGQSLFEITIALALVSVVLITLVAMAALSLRNSIFSRNQAHATRYAQETIEWLRGQKDSDWVNFSQKAGTPKWCLPTLNWNTAVAGACTAANVVSGSIFRREVEFTNVTLTNVEAEVTVYWQDARGFHEAKTSTVFTNWR